MYLQRRAPGREPVHCARDQGGVPFPGSPGPCGSFRPRFFRTCSVCQLRQPQSGGGSPFENARALSGGEATAEVEIRAVLATHPILPLMRGNFQDRVVWSYPCQVDYVNKAC
jgi:hypothetical protein